MNRPAQLSHRRFMLAAAHNPAALYRHYLAIYRLTQTPTDTDTAPPPPPVGVGPPDPPELIEQRRHQLERATRR